MAYSVAAERGPNRRDRVEEFGAERLDTVVTSGMGHEEKTSG
jgi:hypothetical protein